MNYINLIDSFDREIEVLEINDTSLIYAIDQKNEVMDVCHIGRYDFESGEKEQLAILDYTRLYESFQTYGQSKDYFYAMNVLQDYKLRLRRINKRTWSPEGELIVEALGEILNLFIIDEQYLLVVDEVKKTEEFLDMYHLHDDGSEYINICYLYDCFSKKRYPVTDPRLHGYFETVKIMEAYDTYVVFSLHHGEDMNEERASAQSDTAGPLSAVYYIERQALIDAITGHRPLFLEEICVSDEQTAVRYYENDHQNIVYRQRNFEDMTEQIVSFDLETEASEVIRSYSITDSGRYFYDAYDYHVYYTDEENESWLTDDEQTTKFVSCLTDPSRSFSFSGVYGEFSGICRQNLFLSTFYKEVMIKEYEYHEYVAIHDNTKQSGTEVFEGRFAAYKDKIILLKTFLAL